MKKNMSLFWLATICALPFGIVLAVFAAAWLFNKPQLFSEVIVPCMFVFPIILILAVVDLILIVVSWIRSPPYCKLFLFLYFLFIVGFMVLCHYLGPL